MPELLLRMPSLLLRMRMAVRDGCAKLLPARQLAPFISPRVQLSRRETASVYTYLRASQLGIRTYAPAAQLSRRETASVYTYLRGSQLGIRTYALHKWHTYVCAAQMPVSVYTYLRGSKLGICATHTYVYTTYGLVRTHKALLLRCTHTCAYKLSGFLSFILMLLQMV